MSNLKIATPDTTIPAGSFIFGADSQAAASPSVYPIESVATFVNVKRFGAAGDGVTDDTAAINAAIASLDTGIDDRTGGTVYFPAGTYMLSGKLSVTTTGAANLASIKLQGAGINSTILKPKVGYTDTRVIDVLDSTYCSVEELMVNADSKCTHGIVFTGGSHIDCTRVFVQNATAGDGFRFDNVFMVRVSGCRAKANGNGFNFNGTAQVLTSLSVINCYALNNSYSGFRLFDVVYSSFLACASDTNQYGYVINACNGVKFINCGAEDCTRSAFYAYNSAADNAVAVVDGISAELDGCFAYNCNTANAGYGTIYSEQADTGRIRLRVTKFVEQSVVGAYSIVTNAVALNHEVLIEDKRGFTAAFSGAGILPDKEPNTKTAGISVTAVTSIVGLQSIYGNTGKYAGDLLIIATNAPYGEDATANMAVYMVRVINSSVPSVTLLSSTGLTAGGDTGHPSFTWSVTSNALRATPVASTTGTFYFYIEAVGGIRLLAL